MNIPCFPHRDQLLPRHHVRHSRPILSWLICTAACLIAVATVAAAVHFTRSERERISTFFSTQDTAREKITIVYEDTSITCTVPRDQERAAAVVNQGCNALAGALKAAGVIK